MPTITLTLEVTDEERERLVGRFIDGATPDHDPVTGEIIEMSKPTVADVPAIQEGVDYTSRTTDLDENGVAWHPDYHSSSRKITSKGSWKRIRGGDKNATDAYEASYANGEPVVLSNGDSVELAPEPVEEPLNIPDFLKRDPVTGEMPTKTPMGMPIIPPAPPPAPPVTYEVMMAKYKEVCESLTPEYVNKNMPKIYQMAGVTDLEDLTVNETLRESVVDCLQNLK